MKTFVEVFEILVCSPCPFVKTALAFGYAFVFCFRAIIRCCLSVGAGADGGVAASIGLGHCDDKESS